MQSKDYDGAIEDFRRPMLAQDRLAQKYLQQARALRKKRQKREQKVWSQAFSLSASESKGESKADTSTSPPAPSAADMESSLGVDSSPTDPATAPSLEDLLPSRKEQQQGGKMKTATSPQKGRNVSLARRQGAGSGWWSTPVALGAVGVGLVAVVGAGIWAFASSRNNRESAKQLSRR